MIVKRKGWSRKVHTYKALALAKRELVQWTQRGQDFAEFHILPVGDMKEHDETTTCWCEPLIEDRSRARYRRRAVMVLHKSMDGRELVEEHGVQ